MMTQDDNSQLPKRRVGDAVLAVGLRSVVMVDMVAYSDATAKVEAMMGVGATALVDVTIQTMIDAALRSIRGYRTAVMQSTGDGAVLMFRSPDRAIAFASALQSMSRAHNRGPGSDRPDLVTFCFRIGVATGMLARTTAEGHSGFVFSRAARMESACDPGGVLIDAATWTGASAAARSAFGLAVSIKGKRFENFIGHRARLYPDAQRDAARPLTTPRRAPMGLGSRALRTIAGRFTGRHGR